MGDFANDEKQREDITTDIVMCTNCGELVREKDLDFINGHTVCSKCK